jgi:hypothetical protein
MRQQIVDDIGPLALGDELARIIFRQALVYYFQDFIEPPQRNI